MELAAKNPDINYVGIEKYSSVLIRALEKMSEMETPLANIRFVRMDAEAITKVFGAGEVDRIYLNFSDPWPKDRHAKRRLTSKEFFARYNVILKADGRVEFKTDNRPPVSYTHLDVYKRQDQRASGYGFLSENLYFRCKSSCRIYESKTDHQADQLCG